MNGWSNADIIMLYRTAKDKDAQIDVLAQLTSTDIDTIVEILKDANEYIQKGITTCSSCGRMFLKRQIVKGKCITCHYQTYKRPGRSANGNMG